MGGGKTSTSTQSVTIPPEVLARYNAVNARAEQTATQPFQQYSGEFVAPLNPVQQAGIQATNVGSQLAQPYYGAAAGMTLAGAQDVGPLTQGQIGYYQNPYTQAVVNPTLAALGQQFGQQQSAQQAQAIKAGAFGGERAGLQRAQLAGQQGLAAAQAIAPLYQQGYQQAVQTAGSQQGVIAQDLARRMQAGQQLAGLGTGAQQAALQGAQAQIGAGTLGQQTQQAQDTAVYQQFLQERGYPFQVAQFLANIAEGTGALSGSTTTTTQPRGFFSNRGGFKTGESLNRSGKAYGGGLMPNSMGGPVYQPGAFERGGYALQGAVDASDLSAILQQQRKSFGPFGGEGPYGQSAGAAPHGPSGIVPQQQMHVPKLMTAGALPKQQSGDFSTLSKAYGLANEATQGLTGKGLTQRAGEKAFGKDATPATYDSKGNVVAEAQPATKGFFSFGSNPDVPVEKSGILMDLDPTKAEGGGIMPRHHFEAGGSEDSQGEEAIPYDPSDVQGTKDPMEGVLKAGSQKHEMLKPGGGGGSGGSGVGSDLMKGAQFAKTAFDIGKFFFAKDGGIIPRQHHAEGKRAVWDLPIDEAAVERQPGLDPSVVTDLAREGERTAAGPTEMKGLMVEKPAPRQQDDQGRDLSPEALRQYTATRAKELGIDPKIPLAVWHGESSFNHGAQGDEKSSFGVPQLHYGNISEKYPRAGLGDDFTKKTGLHAGDPNAAYDTIDYGLQHAAKNGWGAWSVARQLGYADGKGAPSERGAPSAQDQALGAGKPTSFIDGIGFNKQTILPLLQGIGAMASSKSISPWAAALQGLGAGAKAYGDVEQQQATTAQIQEQTSRLKQVQLSGDIIETAAGPMVLLPGGRKMRQGDWIRAKMPLTLSQTRYGAGAAGASTPSGADLGAVGAPATQAQKYLESVLSPNLPSYQRLAEENALTASSDKLENLEKQGEEFNPFRRASESAASARMSFDPTRNLAEALSRYPEGGPITANVIQPVIDRLDDLFKRVGISVPAFDERASASDVIDKYRTQMGAAAQSASGSKAYAELQSLMSAIPSKIQSKSGQADLVSAMIMANQTPKDEDAALRSYRQYVEQKHGLTPGQSQYAGRGVAQELTSNMQPRISQEKQIIKSMFLNGIKDKNTDVDIPIISAPDGTKKPGTLLSYLYQNAGSIPDPKVADFLYRNYGKDNVNRMLRIFRGGQ
jgi:hypothetical protein